MPLHRSFRKASLLLVLPLLLNSAVPAFALKQQEAAQGAGAEELGNKLKQLASAAGFMSPDQGPTVRPELVPARGGSALGGEGRMVPMTAGAEEQLPGRSDLLEGLARTLAEADPQVFDILRREYDREHNDLTLIASEAHTHPLVLAAMALSPALAMKYGEGYPERRFYPGMEVLNDLENLARWRMLEAFRRIFPEIHEQYWANVQPHSGSNANLAVHMAVLQALDATAGIDLYYGGHLTHGFNLNFSGKLFKASKILVDPESGEIDWDRVEREFLKMDEKDRPRLIILGGTAVTTQIDWERARQIADKIGAVLVADISHNLAQILAGDYKSPFPHAHFVTFTTHKTMGPRGAIILVRKDVLPGVNEHVGVREKDRQKRTLAELTDAAIIPGTQGGPKFHDIAAKVVWAQVLMSGEFINGYAKQIGLNAKALAAALWAADSRVKLVGPKIPETHLLLMDVRPFGLNGHQAEKALESMGILANANMIPVDPAKDAETWGDLRQTKVIAGGIRIGVPGPTSRGMKEPHMKIIADLVAKTLAHTDPKTGKVDEEIGKEIRRQVRELTGSFPVLEGWRTLFHLVGDQATALERATAVFSRRFSEDMQNPHEGYLPRIARRLSALELLSNSPSLSNLPLLRGILQDPLELDEVRMAAARLLPHLPYNDSSQVTRALEALNVFMQVNDNPPYLRGQGYKMLLDTDSAQSDRRWRWHRELGQIQSALQAQQFIYDSFDKMPPAAGAEEPAQRAQGWLDLIRERAQAGTVGTVHILLNGAVIGNFTVLDDAGRVVVDQVQQELLKALLRAAKASHGRPVYLTPSGKTLQIAAFGNPTVSAAGVEETVYRGIFGESAQLLDPTGAVVGALPGTQFLVARVRGPQGNLQPIDGNEVALVRVGKDGELSVAGPKLLSLSPAGERERVLALNGSLLAVPPTVTVRKDAPWTPVGPGGAPLGGLPVKVSSQPEQQGIRFEIAPLPAADADLTRYLLFRVDRADLWQAALDHYRGLSGRVLDRLISNPGELKKQDSIIRSEPEGSFYVPLMEARRQLTIDLTPRVLQVALPSVLARFVLRSAARDSLASLRSEIGRLQQKLAELSPPVSAGGNIRTLGIVSAIPDERRHFAEIARQANPAMSIITGRNVAELRLKMEALGLRPDALLLEFRGREHGVQAVEETELNVPTFLFGESDVVGTAPGRTNPLSLDLGIFYARYPISYPDTVVYMLEQLSQRIAAAQAGAEEMKRQILTRKAMAVIAVPSAAEAIATGRLVAEAGIIPEVTFRGKESDVLEAIRALSEELASKGIPVAAGSVLTAEQVRAAVRAGARIIVSPGFIEEVTREAGILRVLAVPAVGSPEEAVRARRAGFTLQKLFPFHFKDEKDFTKALKAPLPPDLQALFDQLISILPGSVSLLTFSKAYQHLVGGKPAETFSLPPAQGLELAALFQQALAQQGFSDVQFMPTGGVTPEELPSLIGQHGIAAVGLSVSGSNVQVSTKVTQIAAAVSQTAGVKEGWQPVRADTDISVWQTGHEVRSTSETLRYEVMDVDTSNPPVAILQLVGSASSSGGYLYTARTLADLGYEHRPKPVAAKQPDTLEGWLTQYESFRTAASIQWIIEHTDEIKGRIPSLQPALEALTRGDMERARRILLQTQSALEVLSLPRTLAELKEYADKAVERLPAAGTEELKEYADKAVERLPAAGAEERNSRAALLDRRPLTRPAQETNVGYVMDAVVGLVMGPVLEGNNFLVTAEGYWQAKMLRDAGVSSDKLLVLVADEEEAQDVRLLAPQSWVFRLDMFNNDLAETRRQMWQTAKRNLQGEEGRRREVQFLRTTARSLRGLVRQLKEILPLEWQEARPIQMDNDSLVQLLRSYEIGV